MLLYLLAAVIDEPVATLPPSALPPTAPPHNYLKPLSVCDKGSADEVVVCGRQDERYRLHPVDADKYADAPIRAETGVAGGVLGVTASRVMLGGTPSNRVMLNFRIKF
jgi:hypothetical protein